MKSSNKKYGVIRSPLMIAAVAVIVAGLSATLARAENAPAVIPGQGIVANSGTTTGNGSTGETASPVGLIDTAGSVLRATLARCGHPRHRSDNP